MNFDVGSSAFLVDYVKWFHVRIKLLPLPGPVGPNLSFPDDTPSFRCFGPANVLTHERQGAVDIPMIEGRVCLSYQCLCIRHESSGIICVLYTIRFKGETFEKPLRPARLFSPCFAQHRPAPGFVACES